MSLYFLTYKSPVVKMTPLRPSRLLRGSVAQVLARPKMVGLYPDHDVSSTPHAIRHPAFLVTHAELIKPTSQVFLEIPNSSGKERFAPFAPVLSHPLRAVSW